MKPLLLLIIYFLHPLYAGAQDDSLIYVPRNDTTDRTADNRSSQSIDDIVVYSASDSAVLDIKEGKIFLYNNAELNYKEYKLQSARIILYSGSSVMEAYGIPDSTGIRYTGTPVFYEGSKRYDAFRLKYSFRTRKGTIELGTTEIEGGYYSGEKIKKVDENIYFVKNGRYTTCDKDHPHYYFGSPKMKIIQGDKVIAEPVYLYVDDVPVFFLPFGIFPSRSGRSSGLIPPAYGEDITYGRYLSRLGYFWAISDYMDLTLQGNYYTKGRIDVYGRYRYALRYKFTGSLELGVSRIRIGEENDNDKIFSDEWRIGINHAQSINPTTNLTASVNILSGKNYYNTSTNNLSDLLRQNAISNITITKFWEETPNSISVNYSRDQNLITGELRQVIPSVNFVRSQSFPFRGRNTLISELRWYETISYTYNSQLLYRDEKVLVNPSRHDGNFSKNSRGGIRQNISVTAPVKIYEFSVSPFLNFSEIWYNKYVTKEFNPADSSVITTEQKGFKAFRYFNTGISLNTRLVGIFNIGLFGIKGLRHLLTPQITYSFQPDFSNPVWNAFGTYTNQKGESVKYSFYEREVFGGAPSGMQQTVNFSFGNVLEMKIKDTDTTDKKFQLLNVNAGLSYNFAADSIKFSEIALSYRTQIGNFLNIGGGATFNLYKYVEGAGRINKFLFSEGKPAQLTTFNISLSASLQGGEMTSDDADTADISDYRDEDGSEYVGVHGERSPYFSIPWTLGLGYNYGINRQNPTVIKKYSTLSLNLGFNLTRNWKFTASAGYDVFAKEFTTPFITVYRDLHCWEMSFNWIPAGLYRGYRFELRIKAPQLHDVKITRQSNYRGVY